MTGMYEEGVSARTMWGHPNPVVHLIVVEEKAMWCSAGPGRVATVGLGSGTGGGRPCPRCAALARATVLDGMMDVSECRRFLPDDFEPPNNDDSDEPFSPGRRWA